MANLGPQHINQSFGDLLQLPNGLTPAIQNVQDGSGNVTPLEISTTAVDFPISSPSGTSGMMSDLATDAGSNYIGFLQAGTGAVTDLSAQDKMQQYVNVKDFGAIGDGSTDDTIAIQNAFDSLINGGTVEFENGKTYMINGLYQPIQTYFGGVKPASNTIIKGNNATLQVITNSSVGYCVLNLNAVNNIVINDLNIIGDVGTHTGTTGEFGHGLIIAGCSNITLNNLFITLCWGDGLLITEYVRVNGNSFISVMNCEFVNCRRQGMSILDLTNGTFIGCAFRNTGGTAATAPASGVDIEPDYVSAKVSNVAFISCTFSNNTHGHGFIVGSIGSSNVVENIKLVSCSFVGNGASAITVDSVAGVPRVQNVFEIVDCDIKGQVVVENCKIIGGQIILEEIYTNSAYAVASIDDLPFQIIGTSIFVTGTRKAAAIYGSTNERTRKLIANCKINQDNNILPNLDSWIASGGFVTFTNTQMTRTGSPPATAYTFLGANDFDGFVAKMLDCYLDPVLANGFNQDSLMNRAALRGWSSATPTSGYHNVGEIVLNSAPTSAGFIGWVCTVAGTPGTWKTFGLIS